MKIYIFQKNKYLLFDAPTFNFGSSLAANANNSVVFLELGGPKSNVILNRKKWKHYFGSEGAGSSLGINI